MKKEYEGNIRKYCTECDETLNDKSCEVCGESFEQGDNIYCGGHIHTCSEECAARYHFNEAEVEEEDMNEYKKEEVKK